MFATQLLLVQLFWNFYGYSGRSQLCAHKFCLRSSKCKGLKTISFCMHVNCTLLAFSVHSTSEISQNPFISYYQSMSYTVQRLIMPYYWCLRLLVMLKCLSMTHRPFGYMYDLSIKKCEVRGPLLSVLWFHEHLS